MTLCIAITLGQIDYTSAWDLQKSLHRRVAGGELPNLLLLLEHSHVYTLGRRGKEADVLASPEKLRQLGADVHFIDRGGEATYHGPGQLVGYPIVNLRKWSGGPLKYVQTIEKTLISTLNEFGIESESEDRPTGVWVGDAKIAAIGVRISRGVTMHGFALNVDPDLSYFDHIVPCGMPGSRVTSIARELSSPTTVEQVIPAIARRFGDEFDMKMQWRTLDELDEVSDWDENGFGALDCHAEESVKRL